MSDQDPNIAFSLHVLLHADPEVRSCANKGIASAQSIPSLRRPLALLGRNATETEDWIPAPGV